jgi:hypothetical protein
MLNLSTLSPHTADIPDAAVIREAFRHSGYRSLAQLEVQAHSGRVVVSGEVPTYYMKQVAQTLTLQRCGEAQFLDEVRVCS